jgi:hypothetical protein
LPLFSLSPRFAYSFFRWLFRYCHSPFYFRIAIIDDAISLPLLPFFLILLRCRQPYFIIISHIFALDTPFSFSCFSLIHYFIFAITFSLIFRQRFMISLRLIIVSADIFSLIFRLLFIDYFIISFLSFLQITTPFSAIIISLFSFIAISHMATLIRH